MFMYVCVCVWALTCKQEAKMQKFLPQNHKIGWESLSTPKPFPQEEQSSSRASLYWLVNSLLSTSSSPLPVTRKTCGSLPLLSRVLPGAHHDSQSGKTPNSQRHRKWILRLQDSPSLTYQWGELILDPGFSSHWIFLPRVGEIVLGGFWVPFRRDPSLHDLCL